MAIGSTTDKGDPKDNILPDILKDDAIPLTDKDADMKTIDELRGIAGKMQTGFKNLHEAKLSLNEKATVQGLRQTVDVLRQQMEMTHEQMRRLIGMYQTLTNEFDQFKAQRVIELQSWVAGGSTTPEDCDGPVT